MISLSLSVRLFPTLSLIDSLEYPQAASAAVKESTVKSLCPDFHRCTALGRYILMCVRAGGQLFQRTVSNSANSFYGLG